MAPSWPSQSSEAAHHSSSVRAYTCIANLGFDRMKMFLLMHCSGQILAHHFTSVCWTCATDV